MPKVPIIREKDFLAALKRQGCAEIDVNGSHHRVLNPLNGLKSSVPVHAGKDLGVGLFRSILRDLDIDAQNFIDGLK